MKAILEGENVVYRCPFCLRRITEPEAEMKYCIENLKGKNAKGCGNRLPAVQVVDLETDTVVKQFNTAP